MNDSYHQAESKDDIAKDNEKTNNSKPNYSWAPSPHSASQSPRMNDSYHQAESKNVIAKDNEKTSNSKSNYSWAPSPHSASQSPRRNAPIGNVQKTGNSESKNASPLNTENVMINRDKRHTLGCFFLLLLMIIILGWGCGVACGNVGDDWGKGDSSPTYHYWDENQNDKADPGEYRWTEDSDGNSTPGW